MILHGHVFTAPANLRGLDVNHPIENNTQAAAIYHHGYRFCLRYLRKEELHKEDLSAAEAQRILDAGLGLMPVQHADHETPWAPNGELGIKYGRTVVEEAMNCGIPAGVTVWSDLESVIPGTGAEDVIQYCNEWHREVASAGYVPGLYIGWHCGLNAHQLYKALRFTHYWGAYNLNSDQEPIVRGLQMKQREFKPGDQVPGFPSDFQTDEIRKDALFGLPTLLAPEGWPG